MTGYGVLSGEQYVYEADTNNNYDHLSGASMCHVNTASNRPVLP
ncbi:hypothetical protein SGRIM128S_01783 [Streptomyces griseomycini]